MGKIRIWTLEELDYLEDSWGKYSIKSMAKKLGRSIEGVKQKAIKIGLDDARTHYDGITISQLSQAIGIHYSIVMNWVIKYDFPMKTKVFAIEHKVKVVTYKDFWKWAEPNKEMIDFSRFDKGTLGEEPVWAETKRNADKMRKVYIPKSHNTPWSKAEIGRLKSMVANGSYSYPDISLHLKRTEGAIKRKLLELDIKYRPERMDNHRKYTQEETTYLIKALEEGRSFEEIAHKLKRSALGVRGKAERMGYSFKNGVPVRKEMA
ncbi:hypothetical protein MPH47_06165 [Psychrobacillus psychrodurans]|uniref:hypothetical protein n=1 Tax=Psychrobacillus psychrodurans TaxID=126157 RepID=UPI001F4E4941|nr:hypothetical protein [Psychrobacillus psychrodurans]MCK1996815.1 hypothetical protein [Psychrobacillus psychrodurans]